MDNNYEIPAIIEIGRAQTCILGQKVDDQFFCDSELGCGWHTLLTDIDESAE